MPSYWLIGIALFFLYVVSCDSIKEIPVVESQANRETQTEISKRTGLLITRENEPYDPDVSYQINYRGKTIHRDSHAHVNLEDVYTMDHGSVVLVSFSMGGNACEAKYRLITLKDTTADVSDEFGDCASSPTIRVEKDKITFEFDVGYGKRYVTTYQKGVLTHMNVDLDPVFDPEDTGEGYRYLLKHVKKDALEDIFLDQKLSKNLTTLLGKNFESLKDRLALATAVQVSAFIVISGQQTRASGSEEAYLMIALDGSHLYAGILTTEFKNHVAGRILKLYSDKSRTASAMPPAMKTWMNQYEGAKVEWAFQD